MILTDLSNAIRKLLEKISFHKHFKLLLQVKAFSYVKDKTKVQARRSKALRKDIKKRYENNASSH